MHVGALLLSLFCKKDTVRKRPSPSQEESSHQTSFKPALWSCMSSLQNFEKKNYVFKPRSLWYFVRAVRIKTETLANYFISLCLGLLICDLSLGYSNRELLYKKHLEQCLAQTSVSGILATQIISRNRTFSIDSNKYRLSIHPVMSSLWHTAHI